MFEPMSCFAGATEIARAHLVAALDLAVSTRGQECVGDAVEDGFDGRLQLLAQGLRQGRCPDLSHCVSSWCNNLDEVGLRD